MFIEDVKPRTKTRGKEQKPTWFQESKMQQLKHLEKEIPNGKDTVQSL